MFNETPVSRSTTSRRPSSMSVSVTPGGKYDSDQSRGGRRRLWEWQPSDGGQMGNTFRLGKITVKLVVQRSTDVRSAKRNGGLIG